MNSDASLTIQLLMLDMKYIQAKVLCIHFVRATFFFDIPLSDVSLVDVTVDIWFES